MEVRIEKSVFGGDGLARLPGGFIVFVPFTAAGDQVEVRVEEVKAGHARATLVRLLSAGAHRVDPLCPYYGRCGGCQYQHLVYAEECRVKEEQVREAFTRGARLPDVPIGPLIASPLDFGYRNRITVHAEEGRIGFRGVNGRDLIDITRCPIAEPAVNEQLAALRARQPGPGHYSVRHPRLPPSGFHQANGAQLETLVRLVSAAVPSQGAVLVEGYCGGGLFTRSLAPRFDHVLAIEQDARPLRDARRLGLPNVEWVEGDVEQILPKVLQAQANHGLALLLDPPREGLPVRLVEALTVYPVRQLAYLSCNPATLARDARALASAYELQSVQPIDLFPRTAQVEVLTIWLAK